MKKNKTVLVSGHFNVIHPGHVRLLRFAKECGSRLIVAVEGDLIAGSAAYVPEKLRLEGVQSNLWVDDAFIFDESIQSLISKLKPDIVVKGKEHELLDNPELLELEKYGGILLFSSGDAVFSSRDLIRKEFTNSSEINLAHQKDYIERHGLKRDKLNSLVNGFSSLKVCVIGDLIVDEYITCQPLGMSQEDPTLVVMPIDSTKFIGGAGIVAAHAAALGAKVHFISVTGEDEIRNFAEGELQDLNIEVNLLVDSGRPTTLKQRYRSSGKSLLRVSHLRQDAIPVYLQNKIMTQVAKIIAEIDLLVISDFNYGVLPQSLVEAIIEMAKANKVFISADSQSSSQVGNISRFKNVDLITPTEYEARVATRNKELGLVLLAEQVRHESGAKNVLLKLGEEGLLIHTTDANTSEKWIDDRIFALNLNAKDVAGAGDSLLIVSAMVLAQGGTIWEAAYLGSIAAGIQVAKIGNNPLSKGEIVQNLLK